MKFCPNCGTQLPDDAGFCSECGTVINAAGQQTAQGQGNDLYRVENGLAPAYAEAAPKKKKSKKPLIIVGIIAACVALGVGIFFAVRAFTGGGAASDDFVGIQTEFFRNRFGATEEFVAKDTFSSDITISARIDGWSEIAQQINKLFNGSAIVFKTEFTQDNYLSNIILNLQGSNVLELDLSWDGKEVGFQIPQLSDTFYVMNLEEAVELMAPGSGMSQIPFLPRGLDAGLIEEAMKSILNAGINENSLTISKNEKIELSQLGETVDGTLFTFDPSKEDVVAMCEKLAAELETGAAVKALLERMDLMMLIMSSYRIQGMQGSTPMTERSFEEAADELRRRADDIADNVVGINFVWEMATDKSGNLVMISLRDETSEIGYQIYQDGKELKERFFASQRGSIVFRISNEAKVNGTQMTGELSFATPMGSLPLQYDVDTAKTTSIGLPYGEYVLSLAQFGMSTKMQLRVEEGDGSSTDYVFRMDGLKELTDDELDMVEITVNVTDKSTAKKPSGEKEDITDYSTMEYLQLFSELAEGLDSVLLDTPALRDLLEFLY